MLKIFVVLMLVAILGSLFGGLFFLYRDRGHGVALARALTWRIGLSIGLFLVLLISLRYSQ